MTTDLLRVEASERVDKGDFEFLADGAIQADHRQVIGYLFTDPTRNRGWILDGFAIDCPAGKQVRVTLGRAILGQRIGGEVKYGVLTSEGDATKIVDLNAYAPGPYGIYVRFGLVSGDQQSRIFWNPSGAGAEYAQTIATRYNANWSLRVEAGSPGAEWLKIGDVDQASLAHSGAPLPATNPPDVGITDQRAFYFEGSINSLAVAANFTWNGTTTIAATGADTTEMAVGDFIGFKTDGQLFEITGEVGGTSLTIDNSSGLVIPAGAGADTSFVDTSSPAPYASGWSADGGAGGSTADDRKNDRSAYGVADVQMFTAAVRQCLEDIKGRGLRRWYEKEIGGMNIGFGTDPSENVLAIGDANFNLEFNPTAAAPGSEVPTLNFHAGDEFRYNRTSNQFEWVIGTTTELILDAANLYPNGALDCGKVTNRWPTGWFTDVDASSSVESPLLYAFATTNPTVKIRNTEPADADQERFEIIAPDVTDDVRMRFTDSTGFLIGNIFTFNRKAAGNKYECLSIEAHADCVPTAAGLDLGAAGSEWDELHVDDIFVGNIVATGSMSMVNIDASGWLELDGSLTFAQSDTPQYLIDALAFPLNGMTVLAKNTSIGVISRGMLVKLDNKADAFLSVIVTANATDEAIGTCYDVNIGPGASGYITVWGPGYVYLNYDAGVAGVKIGPSAVSGIGENVVADHYAAWLPYTQAGGPGNRLVEGFIVGMQHI